MSYVDQINAAVSSSDNGTVRKPPETQKVELVTKLLERLAAEGIRYCHWKSTFSLRRAFRGDGDLDLLVDRKHAGKFESILALLGFKRVTDRLRGYTPAVGHFFAPDPPTGIWIHIHIS